LHGAHLDRRFVVATVCRTAAVREEQTFIATIVRFAHGGVHTDVGGDASEDQIGNPTLAQQQLKVRGKKCPFAWLIDDGLSQCRCELWDNVPPWLSAYQNTTTRARVTDAGADLA
jgi:hypothetical protein